MQTSTTYPRVRAVRPLPGKKLLVAFSTGETRIYDCQPLLREDAFRPLADEALFQEARPDPHGYAVIGPMKSIWQSRTLDQWQTRRTKRSTEQPRVV